MKQNKGSTVLDYFHSLVNVDWNLENLGFQVITKLCHHRLDFLKYYGRERDGNGIKSCPTISKGSRGTNPPRSKAPTSELENIALTFL